VSVAVAISGVRRAIKELVDGTLRVQIDVSPTDKRDFLRLFPEIDTPLAMAPLKLKADAKSQADDETKGGKLAKLAGMLCGDPDFQAWIEARNPQLAERAPFELSGPDLAAHLVRTICGVESRAQLDHNPEAARRFHESIRKPWADRT
jgi:hypothetical protein